MRAAALLVLALSWFGTGVSVAAASPGQAASPAQDDADGAILVVPFENVRREGRLYWLAEASAVLITDNLRARGRNAISRDDRVSAFERLQLPRVAELSRATVIRIAQLVGAEQVVLGSYVQEADTLVVRARTLRLDTGRISVEAEERGRLEDIFRIHAAIAARLAGPPAGGGAAVATPAQERFLVFESYIKGLLAESSAAQVRFFEAALALDPAYDRARIGLWRVHTEQGRHERARAVVAAVARSSPLSRRARFLAALSSTSLEQHEEAFRELQALAEERPSAEILNNMGVVQLRRGTTPPAGRATYYFNKAVGAAPGDPDYAFNLGYAYWFEKDPRAAVYWLREAVRRNPADGDAHYVLGTTLAAVGAQVEAEREKELARQLSSKYREWERRLLPGAEPVPKGLDRPRSDIERPTHSVAALTSEPGDRDQREVATFHLEHGRRLFEQRQDADAIDALKRSIYMAPYQAEAHLLLGRIHLRNGRVPEAIEAFKISLWSQETVAAHVALGEAYLQAKDMLQARTQANLALTLDPDSAEARALYSRTK
jgi:tetratricopeptide (TPR) repeat protein